MRIKQLALVLVVFLLNGKAIFGASTKLISCENVKDSLSLNARPTECSLTEITVINSRGFTLSSPRDIETGTITFAYNKNIEYLPDNVYQTFPNLRQFDAAACAIRNISNTNFVKLDKLARIHLDGNLIERLESTTFEGLAMLEKIFLSYNKIKFIDSNAFDGLQNLQRADLFNNICINVDFNTESKMKDLVRELTEKCQQFIPRNDSCEKHLHL